MIKRNSKAEKVAYTTEITKSDLRALLKTMAEDDHLLIHRLEIRLKQGNIYRVIARITRDKNAAL